MVKADISLSLLRDYFWLLDVLFTLVWT